METIFADSATSKSIACACSSTSATDHSTRTSFVPSFSSNGHIRAPFQAREHFLDGLRLPVCVVSNIDADPFEAALRHLGWRFDAVVTSEGCRAYKPRGELFKPLSESLAVRAKQ